MARSKRQYVIRLTGDRYDFVEADDEESGDEFVYFTLRGKAVARYAASSVEGWSSDLSGSVAARERRQLVADELKRARARSKDASPASAPDPA